MRDHRQSDVLIMAGGRSSRMRGSVEGPHKALVPILGVTMIERNIRYVITSGFSNVVVAVSAREKQLIAYLQQEAVELARKLGGRCDLLVEKRPLGTIGAAREVDFEDALLVVNVDNLTALPLADLVDHHRGRRAAMTIAAHREQLSFDFGELELEDGKVVEYREKPVRYPLTSSGTYVLGQNAVACIEPDEAIGVPVLFERLHRRGFDVAAYEHDGLWIDVNDHTSLERAELLLGAYGGELGP